MKIFIIFKDLKKFRIRVKFKGIYSKSLLGLDVGFGRRFSLSDLSCLILMGERARDESPTEEEDLLAKSIKKAKGLESLEEVMDDQMTKNSKGLL